MFGSSCVAVSDAAACAHSRVLCLTLLTVLASPADCLLLLVLCVVLVVCWSCVVHPAGINAYFAYTVVGYLGTGKVGGACSYVCVRGLWVRTLQLPESGYSRYGTASAVVFLSAAGRSYPLCTCPQCSYKQLCSLVYDTDTHFQRLVFV